MEYLTKDLEDNEGSGYIYSPVFSNTAFSIKSLESRIGDYFERSQKTEHENPVLKELFDMANIKKLSKKNYDYFFLQDRIKRQEDSSNRLKEQYSGKYMGVAELNILCSVINNEIRKYNLRLDNYNHKTQGGSIPFKNREAMPTRNIENKKYSETASEFMVRHRKFIDGLAEFAGEKIEYLKTVRMSYNKIKKNLISRISKEFVIQERYEEAEKKAYLNSYFEKFMKNLLPLTTYGLNKLSEERDVDVSTQIFYRGLLVSNAINSEFVKNLDKECVYYDSAEMNFICTDAIREYQKNLAQTVSKPKELMENTA